MKLQLLRIKWKERRYFLQKVFILLLSFVLLVSFFVNLLDYKKILKKEEDFFKPQKAEATNVYAPTGGALITGSEVTTDSANTGSWRALLGNDSATNGAGNYWITARSAGDPAGLDKQVWFDNVNLYGANKMILTIEDSNRSVVTNYIHQICDWVNTENLDNTATGGCTGGWRTLQPRRTNYTSTSDTVRYYEIYDGYFSTRDSSPGTVISTPLTNFINESNDRVLIRAYSTVSSTGEHKWDSASLEVAIDPVYEPAGLTLTSAGTTTNYISDIVGSIASGVSASDNNRITIPMASSTTPTDIYFTFKNVKPYTGANTILFTPEMSVSNIELTYDIYLYNFTTDTWTALFGSNITGSATEADYAYSFNSTTIPGFTLSDYISTGGEVRIRYLTNGPVTVRNLLFDRVYMMIGSVNTDSSKCEISWGTGTATDCSNTRSVLEGKTATPTTSTWQVTSALEYPSDYYGLDNDDDTTSGEHAYSSNLSFPVTIDDGMSVTGIHYAEKYRSNNTTMTVDAQMRNYGGKVKNSGSGVGYGWDNTPGTDTNALTTYGWFDSWVVYEQQIDAQDYVNTITNEINLRLRTSVSTNTTTDVTRDWDFAMVSIRWIEEPNRITLTSNYSPTGGALITGSEYAISYLNTGSWRALLGNDSTTSGSGNYWMTTGSDGDPAGLDKQVWFDNVNLYGANKMILTIEDATSSTASFTHQICDWVNTENLDNTATGGCTGGWRTLQPRRTAHAGTSDTVRYYEIYDGYFSTRDSSPGTVISTPLTNFINESNDRVLIRAYSTTISTLNPHRWDSASLEVAIDPVYEPAGLTLTSAGTTTNYISDIVGSIASGVSASDNIRITIPMASSTTPTDIYFTFKNVKPYTGANTILFTPEMSVSNVELTYDMYLYNFTTDTWTALFGSNITGSATETDYAYSFNSTTIPGFTLSDYISTGGEVRIRYLTNGPTTVRNLLFDRVYMMVGSVNTDSSKCEISWGTGTATDCTNTRSVLEGKTATPTTSTWQVTSALEYPSDYYGLDNDDDTTNGEHAYSSNLSFPVTIDDGMSVTGIHYAEKYRSNDTTMTVDAQIRNYGGNLKNSGTGVGYGWDNTPGTDTNALTTYGWFDSWVVTEQQINAPDYINIEEGLMNLRLRTSASTNTTTNVTRDWDFAMMSIRYIEEEESTPGTLAVDIVDESGNSVSSPTLTFPGVYFSSVNNNTSATFGITNEKIRIQNSTSNERWSLSIAPSGGDTALWANGSNYYDFNDPTANAQDGADTDSYGGQMSFDPSSATITPQSGCTNSNISLGSSSAFSEGVVSSITLLSSATGALKNCYWDVTGISVDQTIPAEQPIGTYSVNMVLTITAY